MVKGLFSVYDVKARVFSNPFSSTNALTAQRDFARAANDEQTAICKNPEDFTLYQLAEFDDNTGAITSLPQPEHLGIAVQFKQQIPLFGEEVTDVR